MRTKASNTSLQLFDEATENPELIWTKEMKNQLRECIIKLCNSLVSTSSDNITHDFQLIPVIHPEYNVFYEELANEIFIGGVYIRLFLKQPTFRLSNPVLFLEKLVENWESSFNLQVPIVSKSEFPNTLSSRRDLVLGNEDFLSLLTSCIVCVIKGELSVIDHLLSWEFPMTLHNLLVRALDSKKRGTPVTCIVRLFQQLFLKRESLDTLVTSSSSSDIVLQLTRVLDIHDVRHSSSPVDLIGKGPPFLPKDAAFVTEMLKKIFLSTSPYLGSFVSSALRCRLPYFLIDYVLSGQSKDLDEVRNVSALRIYAVDVIKAIVSADSTQCEMLKVFLDNHSVWGEYRDQSHDLYLTDKEKTDYFLIEDAAETKFAGLLTDGSSKSSHKQPLSELFTSYNPETTSRE